VCKRHFTSRAVSNKDLSIAETAISVSAGCSAEATNGQLGSKIDLSVCSDRLHSTGEPLNCIGCGALADELQTSLVGSSECIRLCPECLAFLSESRQQEEGLKWHAGAWAGARGLARWELGLTSLGVAARKRGRGPNA
jgi:hypothetical protein